MNLSDRQKSCLAADRNIMVHAGAGSGKTRVLVQRFLELLRAGCELRHVIAITFTEKAASEMLDRVRKEIAALAGAASGDERKRWRRLQSQLASASISTIHSFCTSLLREFPVEAGVDPRFQVVEEVEAAQLRQDAIEETLTAAARSGREDHDALDRLLDIFDRGRIRVALDGMLQRRSLCRECFAKFLAGGPQAYLDGLRDELWKAQQGDLTRLLSEPGLLSEMRELAGYTPKNADDLGYAAVQSAADAISTLCGAASPMPEHVAAARQIMEVFLTTEGEARKKWNGSKGNWAAGECDQFKELALRISGRLAGYGEAFAASVNDADIISANALADMRVLFDAAERRLWRLKGDGQRLDFDDLQDRVIYLFEESPAASRVLERLRGRFRYLHVDEFQDTNLDQWRIIRPLLSDAAGNLSPDRGFLVGDAKQSIYGFRNADVRMMTKAAAEFAACPQRGLLSLEENYRSLPMLVDFVNFLFAGLMPENPEAWDVSYEPMRIARKSPAEATGRVELRLVDWPEEDPDAEPVRRDMVAQVTAEAELLAKTIREILDRPQEHLVEREGKGFIPAGAGDIAVLLQRYTHGAIYEAALRRHGIPYIAHRGAGFFERQEVMDVMNLLNFLADELDGIALAGTLRSPLIGLSDNALFLLAESSGDTFWRSLRQADASRLNPDDQAALARGRRLLDGWREAAGRMPMADLLRQILDDSGLWGAVQGGIEGELREANLRKLIEMVRGLEQQGTVGLRDVARRICELADEQKREPLAALDVSRDDAVHMMTIHAAKGLDFPIVIVPDLIGGNSNRTDRVLMDAQLGMALAISEEADDGSKKGWAWGRLQADRARRELAESKRKFYVACTRARDELYLLSRPPGSRDKENWLAWLLDAFEASGHNTFAMTTPGHNTFAPSESFVSRSSRTCTLPILRQPMTPLCSAPIRRALMDELPSPAPQADDFERRIAADTQFIADERHHPLFSPTAVIQFQDCPVRYYLERAANLPAESLKAAAGSETHSGELGRHLGTLTHRLLQDLDMVAEEPEGRLRERAKALAAAMPEFVGADVERYADRAAGMLLQFRSMPRFAEARKAAERHIEWPFLLSLGNALLEGRMDLAYRDAEGTWTVLDYKTSLHRPPGSTMKYRTQMQAYALAVAGLRRVERVRTLLVLLGDQPGEVPFHFEAQDLTAARADLSAVIEEILRLTPDRLVARHGDACEGCGFSRVCRDKAWLAGLDLRRRSIVPAARTE